jgi:hypothetical protein
MNDETTQIQRKVDAALERRERRPTESHDAITNINNNITDIKVILANGDGRMNSIERRLGLLEKIAFSGIGLIVIGTLSVIGGAVLWVIGQRGPGPQA